MLRDAILSAEAEVDAALRNNIATKDALDALSRLMRATQKYREERSRPAPGAAATTLRTSDGVCWGWLAAARDPQTGLGALWYMHCLGVVASCPVASRLPFAV